MKKTNLNPHIPELGEILRFLLNCFDIRRDGNALVFKQVQRLAKGRDLSKENIERVGRSVLDAIYHEFSGQTISARMTGDLLEASSKDPRWFAGLAVDEQGVAHLSVEQFLKDLIEFCWRHQFVVAGLADCKDSVVALQYWLSGFVVPFIASTLVDYHFTGNDPESGMPGGRLWYLPKIEGTQDPARPYRLVMPSRQVLLWWEGLIGRSLENFGEELCGVTSDPDNARRQIAAWRNEAKPPDSETIRRWTSQVWNYQGVFRDDPCLALAERWRQCREFLAGKGMIGDSDWMKGAKDSSFEPERILTERYRGERLDEEIPPFRDFPFAKFFAAADPVGEGLPVEALIQRVAMRWRVPTRRELHSRLLLGRGMNLAWIACLKRLGPENTLKLIRWGGNCYNHLMTVCEKSPKISASESMRIHSSMVDSADPAFYPIAAMFDQQYWAGLPAYLRMWIRGEAVLR